jgi:hypothetical protein
VIEDEANDAADANDEHRDIYAYFGLAYYLSECVHRGLVAAFAYGSGPSINTRPWLEERFTRGEAMTLGEIAQAAAPFLPLPLRESVRGLVTDRNYLAHEFWYERIHETQSSAGRKTLLRFLKGAVDRFQSVSHQLDDCMRRRLAEVGISAERFESELEKCRHEPAPARNRGKLLRVEERVQITNAWLVPGDTPERNGLVLRDREGRFWQLGETGLGWAFVDSPAVDWRVYKRLQRLLPASVVGRPRGAKSWDYQLHLSTGALLSVKRSRDGLLDVAIKSLPSP